MREEEEREENEVINNQLTRQVRINFDRTVVNGFVGDLFSKD